MSRHRYSISEDSLIPSYLLNNVENNVDCTPGVSRKRLGKSSTVAAYLSPEIRALCLELRITPPVDDLNYRNQRNLFRSRTYPYVSREESSSSMSDLISLTGKCPVKNLDEAFACNKDQESIFTFADASDEPDDLEMSTSALQFDNADTEENGADVSVLSEFSDLSLKENVPLGGETKQAPSTKPTITPSSSAHLKCCSNNYDFYSPDKSGNEERTVFGELHIRKL